MKKNFKLLIAFSVKWYRTALLIGFSISLYSCCGSPPQPPLTSFALRTFYKSSTGEDLLDQSKSSSIKKNDIKVMSRIDYAGTIKDVSFNEDEKGIEIYFDSNLKSSYFPLSFPTNVDGVPIATFVTLSSSVIDTVTYTFGSNKFKNIPDKIYYNKKLVWDVLNVPDNGMWQPITIIK